MNISLSIKRALALWADRRAIVDEGGTFTYAQMHERMAQLIRALRRRGVGRGEMVAIVAPNCHQFMEAYYACALSGSVLVPINFRLAAPEVAAILNDSDARLLLAHSDFKEMIVSALSHAGGVRDVLWIGAGSCPDLPVPSAHYELEIARQERSLPGLPVLASDDLAQLYYTSGTTGSAKGVMLTHGNVSCHALSAIAELGLSDADTWLHAAPMFHLADAWATFAATWVGARHVFLPYFNARQALEVIERERVTITNLVPTMLTAMTSHPDAGKFDYSSLRSILSGGAPIAPDTVRRIIATFGCDYTQTYGMTETSPYLTLSTLKSHLRQLPADRQLAIKSRTGRPFLGVDLKVVRADGSEVECDDKEVGEIIVKGPTVTPGYWRKPDITRQTIVDGWLRTGDLAVVDSEGYINIVDRKKDMIITGGENVYSIEVEHALCENAGVLECAVFGVPDDQWGETVKAAVVKRPGHELNEHELIAFVKERIAAYKAPKSIVFLAELPKTGSGKVMKKVLRESHEHDGRHSHQ